MANIFCKTCGDPVEPHRPAYGRGRVGLNVHMGENYLMNQPMSTLDQDERNQLKAWSHSVVPVDSQGNHMDLNVGKQFRRRY